MGFKQMDHMLGGKIQDWDLAMCDVKTDQSSLLIF